ncbi:hypothetical protein [Arcobacter sp. F2176]|uniref:hypothetical protein n=1 Tax=Arcobacter sp. F2176 TaxID=2044511 RepID=UPI00100BF98A|nr:hypothetical protein [Arcobacter sp. F2176]RXJ80306.1 hypothetical protein CRU95_11515 [Arcobacter sp. F2176]
MALIKCPECKSTVSDSAGTCPTCGAKVEKVFNGIEYFIKYAFAYFLAFCALGYIITILFGLEEPTSSNVTFGVGIYMGIIALIIGSFIQHKKFKTLKAQNGK